MPKSKRSSKKMTTASLVRLLRKQGKLSVYTKGGFRIPLNIGCSELKKKKTRKHSNTGVTRSGRKYRKNSGGVTRSGRHYRRGGAKNSHIKNNNNNSKSKQITNKNVQNKLENKGSSLLKDVERNLVERLENIGIDPNALNNK